MKIISTLSMFCLVLSVFAQQGDGGTPISSKFAFDPEIISTSFPQPDLAALAEEDARVDGKGIAPWRFGYVNACNLNTANAGSWFNLPNGGKLWMLELQCQNALTVKATLQNSMIP